MQGVCFPWDMRRNAQWKTWSDTFFVFYPKTNNIASARDHSSFGGFSNCVSHLVIIIPFIGITSMTSSHAPSFQCFLTLFISTHCPSEKTAPLRLAGKSSTCIFVLDPLHPLSFDWGPFFKAYAPCLCNEMVGLSIQARSIYERPNCWIL